MIFLTLFIFGLPQDLQNIVDWFDRIGGPVGFEMLTLDNDAVIIGSGGLYSGNTVGSIAKNPSYLLFNPRSALLLSHRNHIAGSKLENIVYARMASWGYYGFSAKGYFSDNMELHGEVPGPTGETYNGYDLSFRFNLGKRYKDISLGMGIKWLKEVILTREYSNYAFDFGMTRATPVGEIVFSFLNVGPKYMGGSKFRLPLTWRLGLYLPTYKFSYGEIKVGGELVKLLNTVTQFYSGCQLNLRDLLYFRVGKKFRSPLEIFSIGFGLSYSNFCIDYSFSRYYNEIGSSNLITLNWGV